jgi:hypothetical protein
MASTGQVEVNTTVLLCIANVPVVTCTSRGVDGDDANFRPGTPTGGSDMPRGDKSSYTDKQKRQVEHIEASEKKEGRSEKAAERIAWATVNKQDGGGKKSGSGRKPH